jgi:antitoxin ParD1/3/4
MTNIRKTITFTEQQDQWIKAQIATGEFTNDSEYIRDLVRRDRESKKRTAFLTASLKEAEESGVSSRTPDQIRQAVLDEMRGNGEL